MAGNGGVASASLQNENSYDLVCLGFCNKYGTCYLSATTSSLLAMEVTRRAFMNLPHPDSSAHFRIRDESLTSMINFFFLRRRKPGITIYYNDRYTYLYINDRAWTVKFFNRIEKMIHSEFPLHTYFQGNGGCPPTALCFVLHKLREEGYVKGLEEDVWGIYTSRGTCKACSHEHKKVSNEVMLTFDLEQDKFAFFQFLKAREAVPNQDELQEKLDNAQDIINAQEAVAYQVELQEILDKAQEGNNDITRFLTVQHLFQFAERGCYVGGGKQPADMTYLFPEVCCDQNDRRFRTTINRFPLNLIVNLDYLHTKFRGCVVIEEFLDLSLLADPENTITTNAKYKLVFVSERLKIDGSYHAISYIRASKFANEIYCRDHTFDNIDRENMWYKVDNSEVDLVPFSTVVNGMDYTMLIYEMQKGAAAEHHLKENK